MTTQLNNDALPSPIELIDSARQKYTLAQARIRRGPPELALLSLHGSLEDALRAHAIHRRLAVAAAPFPQLLDGLAADEQSPLGAAEAEGIRKMHRLRARVAHGEQITVAAETIEAYHRLAGRLLPLFGVLVVAPEEAPGRRPTRPIAGERAQTNARPLGGGRRTAEPEPPAGRGPRRGGTSTYPLLDRYPDLAGRGAERSPQSRRAIEEAEGAASFFERYQSVLLPALIVLAIFLIGATISIALQSARRPDAPPTAQVATTFAPEITTAAPPGEASVLNASPSVAPAESPAAPSPTAAPSPAAGELAPGAVAYVTEGIPGVNLRAQPGTDQTIVLSLAPGTQVEVLEGPSESGGLLWWRVRSAGVEGWCAADLLEVR